MSQNPSLETEAQLVPVQSFLLPAWSPVTPLPSAHPSQPSGEPGLEPWSLGTSQDSPASEPAGRPDTGGQEDVFSYKNSSNVLASY